LAFYADALNPAGHYARLGVGDLLGWGRFLVPPISLAVGVLLLVGRRDEQGERTRREPARALIGATLTLLAVAGLAALAGGSPPLSSATAQLSAAGGWIGALIGNPLGSALGGVGATTVLVAVLVVAMILLTGVSVSTAAAGALGAVRWGVKVASGGPARPGEGDPDVEDHPTDPFGRTVRTADPAPVLEVTPSPVTEPAADEPPTAEVTDPPIERTRRLR
jgi:4TM region of DNA translocase FtsK/SpoIIIE